MLILYRTTALLLPDYQLFQTMGPVSRRATGDILLLLLYIILQFQLELQFPSLTIPQDSGPHAHPRALPCHALPCASSLEELRTEGLRVR